MNWSDSSEIVLGLILDHRLSVNAVRPELFIEPYNKVIKILQKEPETSIEDLIITTGLSPIQGAFDQVHRMNGLGERDWVKILEQSMLMYDVGVKMGKLGQRMMQGDNVDLIPIRGLLVDIEQDNVQDFVRMSDITVENVPFILTGWKIFDKHMGGFPEAGMVILGGLPGSGKTTAVGRFAGSFVHEHRNKKVALFSLEMQATEIIPRIRNMMISAQTSLSEDEMNRIVVCDKPLNVSEIIGRACKIDDLGLVIVDFIDWAIEGEVTEAAMTLAYNQFAKAAKSLHIPFLIVAQFNDLKGMPKPRNIRWTRMAWALCWMMLMIYDPSINWSNDSEDEKELPVVEGRAYILCWKSRGGFRIHPDDSPGAIQIPFSGKSGWAYGQGSWFSLKKVN